MLFFFPSSADTFMVVKQPNPTVLNSVLSRLHCTSLLVPLQLQFIENEP